MFKILSLFIILLPFECLAQSAISGRVLNHADKTALSNANVFLSSATIGTQTSDDGTFILPNVKPGKYQLVVSNVGFETYHQNITVNNGNIKLPDIELSAGKINLKEVVIKIKTDPNRGRNYEWFKENFLGTSELSKECKILNPDVLDMDYDEDTKLLTASSYDFLVIRNDALGYKIKYLVTDFSFENKGENEKKILYKGPVLFEEIKGTPSKKKRWKKARQAVYENSPMHFLRSALNDSLDEEGFRVQRIVVYDNPDRPSDRLINARLKFYKGLKTFQYSQGDSLSYWLKKSKLPKRFQKLANLGNKDIIRTTNQPGQYALMGDTNSNNNKLFVAYSKSHHYHIKDWSDYLYNANNTENTLIKFNSPDAFFYNNGVITNPYSVIYYGVWGRHRVAELLPINYEEH